ncbi:autotransporter outer membrane beta-barrel domain-containing protein [Bartonella sp. CB74]|uniref:autotransporter outer membrane beta-barrel domain-containing protein n=1 Tax=Bartonella sp. CB74 TaxID=3113620 RepID=UPI002F9690F3
MIKISKNHLPLCTFTTVVLFFVHNANAQSSGQNKFSCKTSDSFYRCNDGTEHNIADKIYPFVNDSIDAAVEAVGKGTWIKANDITVKHAMDTNDDPENGSWRHGVKISEGGKVSLVNSTLKGVLIGMDANYGTIDMQGGLIDAVRIGVSVADKQSAVILTNTTIQTGADAISLFSHGNAKIGMVAGTINFIGGIGVQTGGGGKVILDGVSITENGTQMTKKSHNNKNTAFHMLQGDGSINFQKGTIKVTNAHGILLEGMNNRVDINDSRVEVRSNAFYGMRFFWEEAYTGRSKITAHGTGTVHLQNTTFIVPESTVIYSTKFDSLIQFSKDTKVSGNVLLKAEKGSSVKIIADASTLAGGVRVDEHSTADLSLRNGSKWILSRPRHKDSRDSHIMGVSSISSVDLINSSIFFEKVTINTAHNYQTLRIGKGSGTVYNAQGNAHLYLNTCLDKGGKISDQKTDRVLIHGNISGETIVHVQIVPGSLGELTGVGNSEGISIIQVSGTANQNSFRLNRSYVAAKNSPYQYHLVAYGSQSTLGSADVSQKLVNHGRAFWDFRLESKYVKSISRPDHGSSSVSDPVIPMHTPNENVFHSVTEIDSKQNPETLHPLIPVTPPTVSVVPEQSSPAAPPVPSIPVAPEQDIVLSTPQPHFPDLTIRGTTPPEPEKNLIVVKPQPESSVVPPVPSVPEQGLSPFTPPPNSPDLTIRETAPPEPEKNPIVVKPQPESTVVPPVPSVPEQDLSPFTPPPNSPDLTIRETAPPEPEKNPIVVKPQPESSVVPPVPSVPEQDLSPSAPSPNSPDLTIRETAPSEPEKNLTSVSSKVVSVFEIIPCCEKNVRAVVPQIPTYLLLPNSLFHAGLMDISNQNKQLETMRTSSRGMLNIDENPALFLRGYGSNHRYVSNLSALEYGYGGNLDYNAIETGILLKTIESAYSTTFFGVMGSYGKLSLQPRDVEQSEKSAFDKWTVTAYGSIEHDAGCYIDGLLSYGLFRGDVFTSAWGKTATLRGKSLSTSLTIGKAFMTRVADVVFDPQVQIVYQNLQFHKAHDIDGFDVEMGKPDHWIMRVGGRLTKILTVTEDARIISFYGKFHFIRDFSDKQFVHFKDAFQLGAFGSSLEAGGGIYSQLSPTIILHSDLAYQHNLTKAGFSGVRFSGGLSYRF